MEESMVDTAAILAAHLAQRFDGATIDASDLRRAIDAAAAETFAARIYAVTKTRLAMRVYVTDARGVVLFDSDGGRDEGADYSRWNDVHLTLKGRYGARTTRADPDDPASSWLYVAAPVKVGGAIVGVVTVSKPAASVNLFMASARRKIVWAGVAAAAAVALLGTIASFWITRPIEQLTRHARAIRDGRRPPPPRYGGGEIGALGAAFEEMRDALEGKQYVETYIQTLTHEMKSPLSAIRGAAELLQEEMPADQRARFLGNIHAETDRLQRLIDRRLQLCAKWRCATRRAARRACAASAFCCARRSPTCCRTPSNSRRRAAASWPTCAARTAAWNSRSRTPGRASRTTRWAGFSSASSPCSVPTRARRVPGSG
jgi:two-component system sensor histidine kinase CreC